MCCRNALNGHDNVGARTNVVTHTTFEAGNAVTVSYGLPRRSTSAQMILDIVYRVVPVLGRFGAPQGQMHGVQRNSASSLALRKIACLRSGE